MNVYKFLKDRYTYQIVIAPSIGEAEKLCNIEYIRVNVLYKNVLVYEHI